MFFKNQTKKFTIEPKSYAAMLQYFFFDSLLSTCTKKIKIQKWPKTADSPICSLYSFQMFQ